MLSPIKLEASAAVCFDVHNGRLWMRIFMNVMRSFVVWGADGDCFPFSNCHCAWIMLVWVIIIVLQLCNNSARVFSISWVFFFVFFFFALFDILWRAAEPCSSSAGLLLQRTFGNFIQPKWMLVGWIATNYLSILGPVLGLHYSIQIACWTVSNHIQQHALLKLAI